MIKHKKTSTAAEGSDPNLVRASDWNAEHTVYDPVVVLTSASGVVAVDLAAGDYFTLALTENVTSWQFNNPPGAGNAFSKLLRITQHASAAKTVTMPSGRWDGAPGVISTTLGAVQIMSIISFDNGVTRDLTLSGART